MTGRQTLGVTFQVRLLQWEVLLHWLNDLSKVIGWQASRHWELRFRSNYFQERSSYTDWPKFQAQDRQVGRQADRPRVWALANPVPASKGLPLESHFRCHFCSHLQKSSAAYPSVTPGCVYVCMYVCMCIYVECLWVGTNHSFIPSFQRIGSKKAARWLKTVRAWAHRWTDRRRIVVRKIMSEGMDADEPALAWRPRHFLDQPWSCILSQWFEDLRKNFSWLHKQSGLYHLSLFLKYAMDAAY